MVSPCRARGRRSLRHVALLLLLLPALAAVAACSDDAGLQPPNVNPPAAPEPLTPRGAVTLPASFTWKAVPGDWIYRVTVTDEAERLLIQQDVRNGTSLPLQAELKAMLTERHATFKWSIAIVMPDGRQLAQSAPVAFFLK
jgi:hypothetical protein